MKCPSCWYGYGAQLPRFASGWVIGELRCLPDTFKSRGTGSLLLYSKRNTSGPSGVDVWVGPVTSKSLKRGKWNLSMFKANEAQKVLKRQQKKIENYKKSWHCLWCSSAKEFIASYSDGPFWRIILWWPSQCGLATHPWHWQKQKDSSSILPGIGRSQVPQVKTRLKLVMRSSIFSSKKTCK